MTAISAGTGTGMKALHFASQGGDEDSCGVGFDFLQARNLYDASDYAGVSFGARSVTGSQIVLVKVSTAGTDPKFGFCDETAESGSGEQCYDHFFAEVTLDDTWRDYTVAFADLVQEGWGFEPPDGFDPAEIVGIQWVAKPGTANIWIDDVRFVEEATPGAERRASQEICADPGVRSFRSFVARPLASCLVRGALHWDQAAMRSPSARVRAEASGRLPRALIVLSLLGSVFCAAPARAQSQSDASANDVADKVMDPDRLYSNFLVAEKRLAAVLKKCGKNGCSKSVRARLLRDLGVVYIVGLRRLDKGKEYLTKAIKADPSIELDQRIATPELEQIFAEAGGAGRVRAGPSRLRSRKSPRRKPQENQSPNPRRSRSKSPSAPSPRRSRASPTPAARATPRPRTRR